MKRGIVLLAMLSLLFTLAVPVLAAESGSSGSGDSEVLRYDVNHDGKVDMIDLLMIKKMILRKDPWPSGMKFNAVDYLLLRKIVLSNV